MTEGVLSKNVPKMNFGPIQQVLGENTPDITPTPLGRHRLVSALMKKFGADYRNIPVARKALDHFDSEHDYFQKLRRIMGGY
jgi:hypothetical protein